MKIYDIFFKINSNVYLFENDKNFNEINLNNEDDSTFDEINNKLIKNEKNYWIMCFGNFVDDRF